MPDGAGVVLSDRATGRRNARQFAVSKTERINMIAVLFESWPKQGKSDVYLDMGQRMNALAEGVDGFISIERFRSVNNEGKMLAVSYWRDEEAVNTFRNLVEHRAVQNGSRQTVFTDYHVRIASVLRQYGMRDRAEAPEDSRHAVG